jgi:hypothetical protein
VFITAMVLRIDPISPRPISIRRLAFLSTVIMGRDCGFDVTCRAAAQAMPMLCVFNAVLW